MGFHLPHSSHIIQKMIILTTRRAFDGYGQEVCGELVAASRPSRIMKHYSTQCTLSKTTSVANCARKPPNNGSTATVTGDGHIAIALDEISEHLGLLLLRGTPNLKLLNSKETPMFEQRRRGGSWLGEETCARSLGLKELKADS